MPSLLITASGDVSPLPKPDVGSSCVTDAVVIVTRPGALSAVLRIYNGPTILWSGGHRVVWLATALLQSGAA